MIFKIFKIRNMIREGTENPSQFASSEAGNFFVSMFVMPILSAVLLLGGLFILGYTTLLGGPYGFFKFMFVLSLICIASFFFILRKLYKVVKQSTKTVVNETIKVESKIVE